MAIVLYRLYRDTFSSIKYVVGDFSNADRTARVMF